MRPTAGCWTISAGSATRCSPSWPWRVHATNWRAEQAIRPAVVCRKQWGGNATWDGARTWQVLASVLRTAAEHHRDPVALLAPLLCSPGPVVADLAIPGQARGP
jgi:hypothetical protein